MPLTKQEQKKTNSSLQPIDKMFSFYVLITKFVCDLFAVTVINRKKWIKNLRSRKYYQPYLLTNSTLMEFSQLKPSHTFFLFIYFVGFNLSSTTEKEYLSIKYLGGDIQFFFLF